MGLLSKIFGSDKIIDAGIKSIDAMVYTDEEKSDKKALFLKLYEPYKLAQRYLALIFCVPYSLACFATFAASFFVDVTTQQAILSSDWASISLMISLFYFGGGVAEGSISAFKNKKS